MTNNSNMNNTNKNRTFSNHRFEFLLKINNNIICQRYFSVYGYDSEVLNQKQFKELKNAINSLDLKELVDELCGMNNGSFGECGIIPKFLKDKSVDYLWNGYNPYSEIRKEENASEKDIFKNEDIFTFEIKVDKKIVATSTFSGNWFPTMVRYQVNIKPIIPKIIEEITEFLTRKEYVSVV
jgi:hypothetical protein